MNIKISHYSDVIIGEMLSQITSLKIVYLIVYSGVGQRKQQSSVSLAFVRGIHRWPVNSPHKWSVTRKMFPFDDAVMVCFIMNIDWMLLHKVTKNPDFISRISECPMRSA